MMCSLDEYGGRWWRQSWLEMVSESARGENGVERRVYEGRKLEDASWA